MFRTGTPWLLWSLSLWGSLKLSEAPILQSHNVCGIWGCGPPTNALLACHLGWMVFLAPSVPLAFRYCTQRDQWLSVFFWVLCIAAITGVFATGFHELTTWYPNATSLARSFFLHRWIFAVVTLTDFPMVQLFLYGLAGLVWQKRTLRTNSKHSAINNKAVATVLADSVH